ncbi:MULTISPECIES: trypsin-like peptidase domain-containing protein [unclassified Streptomyces]|uniref:trypsin-like peptidase domain-containing protein n=1 Tax=unclassified Streptomyces TaxID=2593676 RepID=UPI003251152A
MRTAVSWLWDDRLVEVWAWPNKAGSGIAFGPEGVLTSRHVVVEAMAEFEHGRILARLVRRGEATPSWVGMRLVDGDRDWDLAVLRVDHQGPHIGEWVVPLSPSPIVAAVSTAIERDCEAVGFPDENLQYGEIEDPADAVRQTEQVWGTLLPMGQAKSPVSPQRRLPSEWMPLDAASGTPAEQAGWGGMSGAGVLLPDGRLIGVVVDAEAGHEQRRLYLVPLSKALQSSQSLRDALTTVVGAPVLIEPRHVVGRGEVKLVRSAYMHQVQRIAPLILKGRDAELEELSKFCTDPNQGPYVWWQAQAWSGKSALMSWFVLNPPPATQVISFFITARYAAQNDHVAFTDVVLEQLVEILGEAMPAHLTEATREAHMLGMLAEAALACQQRGIRLILVVDGIDEDQGVTRGPSWHSIAALLPTLPPSQMRIVVAGRTHPPVPSDVPDRHPLRDSGVVRVLAPSPYAAVVREDMERELDRLLEGTPIEQDLLGLVTAAGGGLSGQDLADLTPLTLRDVERHLHTVSGRTFARRISTWQPGVAPEVYVLGHEELQQHASAFLGPERLGGYRERLHAWADRYRRHGWPITTPEYLLRGYFRMLHSTAQVPRMVACAIDEARHDRMLDISGGDAAAIAEITTTQVLILQQGEPDLLALARLRMHQEKLAARNESIPSTLPAVWVELHHSSRAEALARSITRLKDRNDALLGVVDALAAHGDRSGAENLARTLSRKSDQITGLTAAGSFDEAERLARSYSDMSDQVVALASLAQKKISLGTGGAQILINEALRATRELLKSEVASDRTERCKYALRGTAMALAASGQAEKAKELISSGRGERDGAFSAAARSAAEFGYFADAEELASSVRDTERQAEVLAQVAIEASAVGDPVRARRLAERADRVANSSDPRSYRVIAFSSIAKALANQNRSRAVELIGEAKEMALAEIDLHSYDPSWWEWSLIDVAEALVAVGDFDGAEALVRSEKIGNVDAQHQALLRIVTELVAVHEYARAEALARSETYRKWQIEALVQIARAVVGVDPDRAGGLAHEVESVARETGKGTGGAGEVAKALAAVGEYERAEVLARSVGGIDEAAEALAVAGEHGRAEALARSAGAAVSTSTTAKMAALAGDYTRAGALAHSIRNARDEDHSLGRLVTIAAGAGEYYHAATIARSIYGKDERACALAVVAAELARAEDFDRARMVVSEAEHTLYESLDPNVQTFVEVARAIAVVGDYDQAYVVGSRLSSKYHQEEALAAIIEAMIARGDYDAAEETARSFTAEEIKVTALSALAQAVGGDVHRAQNLVAEAENITRGIAFEISRDKALAAVARAAAVLGDSDRAEALARSVSEPRKRAEVLVDVAQEDVMRARRLAAEAFTIGYWVTPLRILADVDPGALMAIANDLSAATRRVVL